MGGGGGGVADGDGARRAIGTHDGPDEEVAGAERVEVLVDDQADVQALAEELTLRWVGGGRRGLEALEGRPSTQLLDEVAGAGGDDERFADRPTALGDDGPGQEIGWEYGGHGTVGMHVVVDQEAVPAGPAGARNTVAAS